MRTRAIVAISLLSMTLLAGGSAQAKPPRVTIGDVHAIFQAFMNGGWSIVNGDPVDQGAPADFFPDSMARINPAPAWNGRHFCSLDWHVINVALNEGNPVGGTRTNAEIFEAISQRDVHFTLDGAPLDSKRSAVKRTTNPPTGLVEAFAVDVGRVMAPEELLVGAHTLRFTGFRAGQAPKVMPPITFFIDAPAEGSCVSGAGDARGGKGVSIGG